MIFRVLQRIQGISTSLRKLSASMTAAIFLCTIVVPPSPVFSQVSPAQSLTGINLPLPGASIPLSQPFQPSLIKGLTVYPNDPFVFDFVIDAGEAELSEQDLESESTLLIKHFMTALTVPEDEMWVNLSPQEEGRIAPEGFGQTTTGKILLEQDYLLKQLTASLMSPDNPAGSRYWHDVHEASVRNFGSALIPVDTYSRVWIVPKSATVYEHDKGAFIVDNQLQVLHEDDYRILEGKSKSSLTATAKPHSSSDKALKNIANEAFTKHILPKIEVEVNQGKTFAPLRQIYNSSILAIWYKQAFHNNALGKYYADTNLIEGVAVDDRQVKFKIHAQYIDAFKKGVYRGIEEVFDPGIRELIPRKIVTGGAEFIGTGQLVQEQPIGEDVEDYVRSEVAGIENGYTVTATVDGIASSPIKDAITENFDAYYRTFNSLTADARKNFEARDWAQGIDDARERSVLYTKYVLQATNQIREKHIGLVFDNNKIERIRSEFLAEYTEFHKRNLASAFFNAAIRTVHIDDRIAIEHPDIIDLHMAMTSDIIRIYNPDEFSSLYELFSELLLDLNFSVPFNDINSDVGIMMQLINDQLLGLGIEGKLGSLEILKPILFRNKAAYVLGRMSVGGFNVPLVIPIRNFDDGLIVDAILVGHDVTRNLILSSTRSSFQVTTNRTMEAVRFIHFLYPQTNPAQIYELFGFDQLAGAVYFKSLMDAFNLPDRQLEHVSTSSESLTFSMDEFPLIFKVISSEAPNRQEIIDDYRKVHQIDRSGQLLNSLLYRNLRLERKHFSPELMEELIKQQSLDIQITDDYVNFKRVYAQRKVTPILEYIEQGSDDVVREALLGVGWNIKHLAGMGLFPSSLELKDFGVTSWGRIVYLNSAAVRDIEDFKFINIPFDFISDPSSLVTKDQVIPETFRDDLNIPEDHREAFNEVHDNLFSSDFWQFMQWQSNQEQPSDIYPYPEKFRLESKRRHNQLIETFEDLGISHDAGHLQDVSARSNLSMSTVEMSGLNFLRFEVPQPRARVLVVEPIAADVVGILHQRLGNVNFDVILSQSEIVEDSSYWVPGIRGRLKELVQSQEYDFVLGYVNEMFDEEFFEVAQIEGLLLFSTGTHNIDLDAATANGTIVTNAPGATTAALAEHNIGLILDALYSDKILNKGDAGAQQLTDMMDQYSYEESSIAQIMWYQLLRKVLNLDEMFDFGMSGRYSRTGVGEEATIYHDQIGQNHEAGINRTIGIVGLDEIGMNLIEMAVTHEATSIVILEEEYSNLTPQQIGYFERMIDIVESLSKNNDVAIEIIPRQKEEFSLNADYILATPKASRDGLLEGVSYREAVVIHADAIFIDDPNTLELSLDGQNYGIQGFGRIGEAVAQRTVPFGLNIAVHQRSFEREDYQRKKLKTDRLIELRNIFYGLNQPRMEYVGLNRLFEQSNILALLTPLTEETYKSINADRLTQLGIEAEGDLRVLISQVKDVVDEDALRRYLIKNPKSQARLDIVTDEERGDAHERFRTDEGEYLPNVKISGHSAAAVKEVRRMKIEKTLRNLRKLVNKRMPDNILNDISRLGKSQVELEGLEFMRLNARGAKAKVLVIEPVGDEIINELPHRFPDATFDVLMPESELLDQSGQWVPGINEKLNALMDDGKYDYCMGYCNADFNAEFFERSKLKGLILFASATHHIDVEAATDNNTLVTIAAGPTTTAVAEQNIGLIMDGMYANDVHDAETDATNPMAEAMNSYGYDESSVAQILWYGLMKQVLKLDEMFDFGMSGRYMRTGVSEKATVYHDQIGQNKEANIDTSIGIVGLNEIGIQLIEYAIAHETSTIYVWKSEYEKLDEKTIQRINQMVSAIQRMSSTDDIEIQIKPVGLNKLMERSSYTIRSPKAVLSPEMEEKVRTKAFSVSPDNIHISDTRILSRSFNRHHLGIFGMSRIGPAVAQRALGFGANLLMHHRTRDQQRLARQVLNMRLLARHRTATLKTAITVPQLISKTELMEHSDILTTLGSSAKKENEGWMDESAFDKFGAKVRGGPKIFVNAVKNQVNEEDLIRFLKYNPGVEARLDVINQEEKGDAPSRFIDVQGQPMNNVKISGHTAAAVYKVRLLKIRNALRNLRLTMEGEMPNQVLNDLEKLNFDSDNNDNSASSPVGGIDLKSDLFNLKIERNVEFKPISDSLMPDLNPNFSGFSPSIIQITPLHNLILQLGLSDDGESNPDYPEDISGVGFYRDEQNEIAAQKWASGAL